MKLSWHEAHFILIPKNTWETFCENWISRTWLALTRPRHLIPLMNPSDSDDGLISSRTNRSYGLFVDRGAIEPAGDLLAAAIDVAGAGVIVAEQVIPEGQPVVGIGHDGRRGADGSTARACRRSGRSRMPRAPRAAAAGRSRRGTTGGQTPDRSADRAASLCARRNRHRRCGRQGVRDRRGRGQLGASAASTARHRRTV